MQFVSIYDGDENDYEGFPVHKDIRMVYIMREWCNLKKIKDVDSVLFRDEDDNVICNNMRLKELPTVRGWPLVTKMVVVRIDKEGSITTSLLKPEKMIGSWTIEPTRGEMSKGRWLPRPILTRFKGNYEFLVSLRIGGKESELINVVLGPNEGFPEMRNKLAVLKGGAPEDFYHCYEVGGYFSLAEGIGHCTSCVLDERYDFHSDDDFSVIPEEHTRINLTARYLRDDSEFYIPMYGVPVIYFYTKRIFLCPSKDDHSLFDVVSDGINLHDDLRVIAFVDGFCLQDTNEEDPQQPRLFISLDNGNILTDISSGEYVVSTSDFSNCPAIEAIAKEHRKWDFIIFVFYDREPLPHWRIPDNHSLQVQWIRELRYRIEDGCLTTEKPRSEIHEVWNKSELWTVSTTIEENDTASLISQFMKSQND